MRIEISREPLANMKEPFRFTGRIRSFKFAFVGIWTMLKSQHNAWVHAFATVAVVGAGFLFRLSAHEWCWLVLAIMAVWTAEALNTAFEFLADAASPEFHPLVKHAKDVAAGAVLIAAIGAAIIGLLILGPHLLRTVTVTAAIPIMVAHRGASFDAPENTLAAYRLAWEQNTDAIEGDFRMTSDGRMVVCHDPTTKRCGTTNLVVADSTFDELRKVDVGAWFGSAWQGERLPAIEEVLATVPPSRNIYIEYYDAAHVHAVKKALADSKLKPGQVVVISFDQGAVKAAKEQIPGIKAFWLAYVNKDKETGRRTTTPDDLVKVMNELKADGVSCMLTDAIDAAFVKRIHDAGYEFHVWTVDNAADAQRYKDCGVDSITSNRAGWLKRQLRHTSARPKSS